MPVAAKSALLTKRDLGSFVTKVVNTQRLMGEVVGDREKDLQRLNRALCSTDGSTVLEEALRVLSDLANTSTDQEIRLKAAQCIATTITGIEDALQKSRLKVAELGVLNQQHQDTLQIKLLAILKTPSDDMSDEELLKEYQTNATTPE